MKALLYEKAGRSNAKITDIPYPECKSGHVIVKVVASGICIGVETGHDNNGTSLSTYPSVPGHEFSGTIHEIGDNVSGLKIGDRVTVDNAIPCGHCFYCKRYQPLYCENFGSLGHNIDGGMAEFALVDANKIYPIPDHVSFNAAAMAEPVACCIHGLDRLNILYGDEVLILGAGPQGIILAQLVKRSNASKVVVVGSTQSKLDIIENLGIETILMDRNDYSVHEKKVLEAFPLGVDCLIDASGAAELVSESAKLMKMGGRVLGYAYYHTPNAKLSFPFPEFWLRECTYYSSFAQMGAFDRAVDAIASGKVNTDVIVSHEYILDDYFEALDFNINNREAIKVIIRP